MWSEIENVLTPATPAEAQELARREGYALIAGGSYLASRRPAGIHTLVNVAPLLGSEIENGRGVLRLGAGTTLQGLVEGLQDGPWAELALCARRSCSSKLLRNQRTLGGEIAWGRADSELYAALRALDARLHLAAPGEESVPLREWDGGGVIASVELREGPMALQRFALLPSAPAFVIVVGVRRDGLIEVAVGGRAERTGSFSLPVEAGEKEREKVAAAAADLFPPDHYGSVDYKRRLVSVALKRIRERL